MSGRVLSLARELIDQLMQAAQRAYPNECCGLIEGIDVENGWRVVAVHETLNISSNPRRAFLIDPQAQFDLLRRLRGTERRIIGCFHSHPGGSALPSAADRAVAYETDFLYLIAAGAPERGFTLAAHLFTENEDFIPIALQ